MSSRLARIVIWALATLAGVLALGTVLVGVARIAAGQQLPPTGWLEMRPECWPATFLEAEAARWGYELELERIDGQGNRMELWRQEGGGMAPAAQHRPAALRRLLGWG